LSNLLVLLSSYSQTDGYESVIYYRFPITGS
jgi:hypothetical protein